MCSAGTSRAVEEHLAEFGGDTVDHPQRTLLHARLFHRDDERRDAAVALGVRIGAGQQQTPVGDIGVAGPDLVSLDDVVVTVAGGGGGQRREVRTGAGLAEALAPSLGAVDHAGQEPAAQLLTAVSGQAGDQVAEAGPGRGAGPRQLFVEDDVVHRRQLLPAVLARPGQPEEAALVQRAMPFALPGPVLVARARKLLGVQRKPRSQPITEGGFVGRITKVQRRSPPA